MSRALLLQSPSVASATAARNRDAASPGLRLVSLRRRAAPPPTTRFRLRTVDIGGPVTYADFGGEGPTLVLLHGLGGNHLNWLPAAPMLAKHARVLAVDLLGF